MDMNAEQYERWLDFAQRMALQGWPHLTEARKQKIHRDVTVFISFYSDCHEDVEGWDSGPAYVCDHFEECFGVHKHWENENAPNRYHLQLSCCIRAGVDVATEDCCGVVGFTLGDVRRMFNGQLPDWFVEPFEEPALVLAASDDETIWL